MMSNRSILITANQLHAELGSLDVRIVDGSWHLPNANRDAFAEFESGHIQGAQYFNIDVIADTSSGLPHTLPSANQFAQAVGAMGISNSDRIVIYDTAGMFSAARVWWMFKIFGAKNIRVLDGGLPAWKAAGFGVTDRKFNPAPSAFEAEKDSERIVALKEMREQVDASDSQILDARGPGRFTGQEAEPRQGMRAGHMPGATNIPYSSLLNADGTFKSHAELQKVFEDAQVDPSQPIITTCGSGVTASIILLALELLGHTNTRLYDGSWAEWGSLVDTPVEKD